MWLQFQFHCTCIFYLVDVGFEYASCSRIFWHSEAATLAGHDLTSSKIGGWNLDIHHVYNHQDGEKRSNVCCKQALVHAIVLQLAGILYKGDGTNVYLKEQPRKVLTIMGSGSRRSGDCVGCDGEARNANLLAPVALASGRDGSIYVGDFNFVRKIDAERNEAQSILRLEFVFFNHSSY